MENNKKQTYLQAGLILMVANLVVRGIGGIFKIPIIKLLGDVGYANYQDAYTLYVIFFAISTAGLPVAISRMIAVANSNKKYAEEKKIFNLALISFVIVGAAGTAIMIFGAGAYSKYVAANPDAYYSILILAPTLFFVCITSAFRGYFQGRQNFFPTAVSEVIEALGKLFIGLAAAVYAINMFVFVTYKVTEEGLIAVTEGLDIASAFAISGLTIGSAFGVGYLIIKKILTNRKDQKLHASEQINESNMQVRKSGDILKEIIKISVPLMLTSSIASLAGAIDTFMMKQRLMDIGWDFEIAKGTYGAYTGKAVTFFNLPNTLVVAFAVSIIPVISTAFSNNNLKAVKTTIESTFRVVSIIAMPCAFGLACMSKPILSLIFSNEEAVLVAPMLSILGVGVVFVSFMTVTNNMLAAQGQERKTLISMAVGMCVKIIASYILIGIPEINKFGTPIGTCLCYLTIMSMNFYFLAKYTKVVPAVRQTFIKPFISSAVMAVFAILSYMLFNNILQGSRIAVLAALVIAISVYAVCIILFKTLTKDDVLLLPKGAKLYEAMKKRRLIN